MNNLSNVAELNSVITFGLLITGSSSNVESVNGKFPDSTKNIEITSVDIPYKDNSTVESEINDISVQLNTSISPSVQDLNNKIQGLNVEEYKDGELDNEYYIKGNIVVETEDDIPEDIKEKTVYVKSLKDPFVQQSDLVAALNNLPIPNKVQGLTGIFDVSGETGQVMITSITDDQELHFILQDGEFIVIQVDKTSGMAVKYFNFRAVPNSDTVVTRIDLDNAIESAIQNTWNSEV